MPDAPPPRGCLPRPVRPSWPAPATLSWQQTAGAPTHLPHCFEVIGAHVLVLQVVCMLPHVDAQQWDQALRLASPPGGGGGGRRKAGSWGERVLGSGSVEGRARGMLTPACCRRVCCVAGRRVGACGHAPAMGGPPAPALAAHLCCQRVLVGAGGNLQAAGRLVVAQPAPARALQPTPGGSGVPARPGRQGSTLPLALGSQQQQGAGCGAGREAGVRCGTCTAADLALMLVIRASRLLNSAVMAAARAP
jgi:hypothetical protein